MDDPEQDIQSDPLEQIPDPDTVRGLLADAVRRCDLLRSLLRVSVRKEAYRRPAMQEAERV